MNTREFGNFSQKRSSLPTSALLSRAAIKKLKAL